MGTACLSSRGAAGRLSRLAGIGAGMAIEMAAKREIALMRMDVVFIFAVDREELLRRGKMGFRLSGEG